jgi:hypothetical protein
MPVPIRESFVSIETLAPEITVLLRELMVSVVSDADVEQPNE